MGRTVTYDRDLEARLKAALADKYVDLRPLNETGGMGTVYLARHRNLEGWDVIKVLRPEFARQPEYVERFLREGRILKELSRTCDNIPSVHDLYDGREQGLLFMTMQYIEGESLAERLKSGPLGTAATRRICRDVLLALDEAHRRQIVHRDVKPANILIDKRGKAWLVDFGIAKALNMAGVTRPDLTIGTTEYMSPEQIAGVELDARSDLYSFGCVLYECMTGRRLFPSDHRQASIGERFNLADPIGNQPIPNCPTRVVPVIRRLVSRDRKKRPASAREVMELLDLGATRRRAFRPTITHWVWGLGSLVAITAVLWIVVPQIAPDGSQERVTTEPIPTSDPGESPRERGTTEGPVGRSNPVAANEKPEQVVEAVEISEPVQPPRAGLMQLKVRIIGGSARGGRIMVNGADFGWAAPSLDRSVQVTEGESLTVRVIDAVQSYETDSVKVEARLDEPVEVEFVVQRRASGLR